MTERRSWTWPWLIAVSASRAVLAVVVGLALWGALPAVAGWHPTTVSSGSMLPRLHVGDVAVSRPLGQQPPALDSVLLFTDPDHPDRLRLHRFVAVDPDGRLITRGDANPDNDSTPVDLGAVLGVGTLRVPYVGLPVIWWRTGNWVPLALTFAGLIGLSIVAGFGRRFTFDPPENQDAPGGEPAAAETTGRSGSMLRVVDVIAAGSLLAVVALPAGAAFSATTSSTASLTANPYFTCINSISANSPYLWYRMEETTAATSASDSSGNGRTGTYTNSLITIGKTAVTDRSCVSSADSARAMSFNENTGNSYLSSPAVAGAAPNTFTISIRFKTTGRTGGKLIGYGSSRTGVSASYDRHLYLTNDGRVIFGVYPNAVRTVTSDQTYRDGAWHQATATLSSAGMRLYVDGELVGSDPNTTTGQALTGGYWRIAYDNLDSWTDTPSSRYFIGVLDDAVVYSTALSADQIKAQWVAAN